MGIDGLGVKRSAVTNYVYRLLSRNRTLETISGDSFLKLTPSLRANRFTGLVLVEMPGGVIGRMLYQNGRLVNAGQSDLEPQDALRAIRSSAHESTFARFAIEPDQAYLAMAAVDGVPYTVGTPVSVDGRALFEEQRRKVFSGVLALEAGSSLLIWYWLAGQIRLGSAQPPSDLGRYRLIHIAWNEREIPELGLAPARSESSGSTSSEARPRGGASDANQEIWQAFADLMRRHLADRAPRLVNLMRQEHADHSGAELVEGLAHQIERVASSTLAKAFRDRFGA